MDPCTDDVALTLHVSFPMVLSGPWAPTGSIGKCTCKQPIFLYQISLQTWMPSTVGYMFDMKATAILSHLYTDKLHTLNRHLPLWSHFLSWRFSWAHFGNNGFSCSCTPKMWFVILSNLASIRSASPSGVEAATQYKLFIIPGIHSLMTSHPAVCAPAISFFFRP